MLRSDVPCTLSAHSSMNLSRLKSASVYSDRAAPIHGARHTGSPDIRTLCGTPFCVSIEASKQYVAASAIQNKRILLKLGQRRIVNSAWRFAMREADDLGLYFGELVRRLTRSPRSALCGAYPRKYVNSCGERGAMHLRQLALPERARRTTRRILSQSRGGSPASPACTSPSSAKP